MCSKTTKAWVGGRLMWNYSNVFIWKSLVLVPVTVRSLVPLEAPECSRTLSGFGFSAQGRFQMWNTEMRGRHRQSEQMKAGGDYWALNGGMTGEWLLFDTQRTDSTLMKWVGIKSIHTACFREFLAHREKERRDLKT